MFSEDALEVLRAIGDSSVMAQILALARSELRRPPEVTALEGIVDPGPPPMWWRRAVPLSELDAYESFDVEDDADEFRIQSCDYRLVYRDMTEEERIQYEVSTTPLFVVRVYSTDDLVRHLAAVLPSAG